MSYRGKGQRSVEIWGGMLIGVLVVLTSFVKGGEWLGTARHILAVLIWSVLVGFSWALHTREKHWNAEQKAREELLLRQTARRVRGNVEDEE